MPRKKDNRERRVRNTLTVDMGLNGLPLLDSCFDGIAQLRRAAANVSPTGLKRGQVVRLALWVLRYELSSEPHALLHALNQEFDGPRKLTLPELLAALSVVRSQLVKGP